MTTTKNSRELYQQYVQKMQKIADIRRAADVLQWDQEINLPAKAATIRGQQIATLTETAHQFFTEDALGVLLKDLNECKDLDEDQQKNVSLSLEDYTKNKKYSSAFVRNLSAQITKTFHAWIKAREQNSFAVYADELDKLVQLKKEETHILGFKEHPYDALLNEYEKGCTVKFLDTTFNGLLPELKKILDVITHRAQVDDSFLFKYYPKNQQWDWGMYLIKELGFDFEAGRQDISEHPFTTSFGSTDVRLTTRIDENDFGNMTWSCIHEAGHGFYEQGLPVEQYGLPLGEAASLGIHESQSRLWENNVGRSLAFWQFYYPILQQHFPDQFEKTTVTAFYKGINKIQPSLIRTESDELTYHFHVWIRYELEKKLIEGSIGTKDIPGFWNEYYEKYIGVKVPDDKRGCLQDVHWSHGSFGYFPTYSLGSLYAAQFFQYMSENDPMTEQQMAAGNTSGILQWLKTNVFPYGRKFTSDELCKKITGQSLQPAYFVNHILRKYSSIYTFDQLPYHETM